jgi:hypothetical protein
MKAKEAMSMRRIKLILAVACMAMLLVTFAAPAMAAGNRHNNNHVFRHNKQCNKFNSFRFNRCNKVNRFNRCNNFNSFNRCNNFNSFRFNRCNNFNNDTIFNNRNNCFNDNDPFGNDFPFGND